MNLTEIQLEDIYEQLDPCAIKNFIISDKPVSFPAVSSTFPFTIDGVAFAICIAGNAQIMINFKKYEVCKNTIITIMPHFVVEYIERSDDLLIEFLIFAPDFITEMPKSKNINISQKIVQNSCLLLTDEDANRYLEYHSFVVKQYKRKDHPFRITMAQALLYSLLIEVGAIYYNQMKDIEENEEANSYQEELVYQFFQLILKHHKEERSMLFYANKMCLTPKYISTIIKKKTGRTSFVWINQVLISSIKYILKTTDKTILQISDEMNFPNPSFFGRFFKKHTSMTPVQYRES